MSNIKYIAYIDRVEDDRVLCVGTFTNAHGKGTHALLHPQVLISEVQWKDLPRLGDTIAFYEDGTREHRPQSA